VSAWPPTPGSGPLASSSRVVGCPGREGLKGGGKESPAPCRSRGCTGCFPRSGLVRFQVTLAPAACALSPARCASGENRGTMSPGHARPQVALSADTQGVPYRAACRVVANGTASDQARPPRPPGPVHPDRDLTGILSSASSPRARRPSRAAWRFSHALGQAGLRQPPGRPRPSTRRRDGPRPSHPNEQASNGSPAIEVRHGQQTGENYQRPNEPVLTPHQGGHDIPSANQLIPARKNRQGHAFVRTKRPGDQSAHPPAATRTESAGRADSLKLH